MKKKTALLSTILVSSMIVFSQSTISLAWKKFPYCSEGFGVNKTTRLLEDPKGWILKAGNSEEQLVHMGSVGTGLNGTLVAKRGTENLEAIYTAQIQMDYQAPEEAILIFRDRVFWPCDR